MQANNEKTFKCLNCGKETTSKRNNIFCSNDCYLEYRKRPNQIIKKELYAELIIRSMRYGTKHIVIDLEDAEKCKNYKWFLSFDEILNSFYVKTSKYPYSLHRVIMDCPKGFVVDHINHNTLDNRKENLRICTHAENMKNRKRVIECVNCIDLKRQNEELQTENNELKAEIKLSKEMLIQNTSETNKYTIPQIIEQFISDNYIDQQNEDGYTIPIFLQLEDILYEKENLEEKLGFAETTKGLQRAEIQKLKQTLTEIKEIAEPIEQNTCFGLYCGAIKEILQKT